MCGLFAAKTKRELVELAKSNIHRGSRTHSVSTFNDGRLTVQKYKGSFDATNVPETADFFIVHVQAPTGTSAKAHPASLIIHDDDVAYSSSVWHNGILKDQYMANQTQSWDSRHIAYAVEHDLFDELDGTFACFHFARGVLSAFRNEISPMFTNEDTNAFSSTKTILTPYPIEPNKVFNIDMKTFKMTVSQEFKTLNNPYFFL